MNQKQTEFSTSSPLGFPIQQFPEKAPAYTDNGIFPDISLTPTKNITRTVTSTPFQIRTQKTISKKIVSPVFTPTPFASTGAILVAPSNEDVEAYSQLIALLSSDAVYETNFSIQPVAKEKEVLISVSAPLAMNKKYAISWLQQHGYGLVPEKYLFFVER